MHNRQPLTLKMVGKSCMDWHLWPVYLIGVLMWIPVTPVSYYLQLSFRQLGFSKIQANLLAVPYGVLSIINVILIAMISELFDNRSFTGMIQFVVSNLHSRWASTDQPVDHTVSDSLGRVEEHIGLAVLRYSHCFTWIPLRTRCAGRMVFAECRVHSYSNGRCLFVQHGGSTISDHRCKCLPGK